MGDDVDLNRESEHDAAARELLAGRDHVDVVAAMTPQQPTRLLSALLRHARSRRMSVTLHVADLTGRFAFLDEQDIEDLTAGRLKIVMLAGSAPRAFAHLVDSNAETLWETDRMLADGRIPCDVYAVRVAEAVDGLELGNSSAFTPTLAGRDGVRLAVEIGPRQEFVSGLLPTPDAWWADAVRVQDTTPLGERLRDPGLARPDALRERIAAHVADLLTDGSTLEVGLGGVADALAERLANRRIAVHTGVLPTSFRAVTPTLAGADPMVCTALAADAGAAAWSSRPLLLPISQTHDPDRLRRLPSLWGVNSGYSVDLRGNVNAEWINGVQVSVGGGQRDFSRAAHASAGAGSVIALASRTGSGRSRILGAAADGEVTTPGGDVDFVVTEWGVADVSGLDLHNRVETIAAVAHPDDRELLLSGRG